MTRDNENKVNRDTGDPGTALEPTDVIQCRACKNMVRRVNTQHLTSDRCMYTDPQKVRVNRDLRDDLKRPDHPETVEEYKEMYPDAPLLSPRERMKLAEANRDEEVDERRREMLRRRWRGEEMGDIVTSLSDRYDVTRSALWKDWAKRDKWIARVFSLEDAEAVVVEALAQKQDVRNELMRVARRAEDQNEVNAAIRALKAVDDNIDETIDHQQKLGNVDQAASEHKVHVEGGVEHAHKHEAVGDGLDEDTLRALDSMTGGDDEDIVDAKFEEVNPDTDSNTGDDAGAGANTDADPSPDPDRGSNSGDPR